jgi:hypothetical protein
MSVMVFGIGEPSRQQQGLVSELKPVTVTLKSLSGSHKMTARKRTRAWVAKARLITALGKMESDSTPLLRQGPGRRRRHVFKLCKSGLLKLPSNDL